MSLSWASGDLPAWPEATAPKGRPALLQQTWERRSCGLQRHLADVMEKWRQNHSGHPGVLQDKHPLCQVLRSP